MSQTTQLPDDLVTCPPSLDLKKSSASDARIFVERLVETTPRPEYLEPGGREQCQRSARQESRPPSQTPTRSTLRKDPPPKHSSKQKTFVSQEQQRQQQQTKQKSALQHHAAHHDKERGPSSSSKPYKTRPAEQKSSSHHQHKERSTPPKHQKAKPLLQQQQELQKRPKSPSATSKVTTRKSSKSKAQHQQQEHHQQQQQTRKPKVAFKKPSSSSANRTRGISDQHSWDAMSVASSVVTAASTIVRRPAWGHYIVAALVFVGWTIHHSTFSRHMMTSDKKPVVLVANPNLRASSLRGASGKTAVYLEGGGWNPVLPVQSAFDTLDGPSGNTRTQQEPLTSSNAALTTTSSATTTTLTQGTAALTAKQSFANMLNATTTNNGANSTTAKLDLAELSVKLGSKPQTGS
mmetsp:Transcript_8892/g.20563  ORF Transcript_8892/g.20563 Transcript_8892/m.20563 type:complete len:406 (+) Transcript_8892:194-1411(+)